MICTPSGKTDIVGLAEAGVEPDDAGPVAETHLYVDPRSVLARPSEAEVPADLAAAIAAEPAAQAMFEVLTKSNRYALIHRVNASSGR